MKKFFFLMIFMLIFTNVEAQKNNKCQNIELIEAVNLNLLSPDLAIIDVNAQLLACPKYLQGDNALCGSKQKTSDKWDVSLPNDLFWTLFFEKSHYNLCKNIFRDEFFKNSIAEIPEPSEDAKRWFKERWNFFTVLLPIESLTDKYSDYSELDEVQRKMVNVFYHIKSWTFCPEPKIINGNFLVHGLFDDQHNIVLYPTACQANKVYHSDIINLAMVFKFHFIGAHEFSHAIDFLNGTLDNETDESVMQSEKRANLNGLLITKSICRLFNEDFKFYQQKVYENLAIAKPCDKIFINKLVNNWQDVEQYLDNEIDLARNRIAKNISAKKIKKTEWTGWGCIEKK